MSSSVFQNILVLAGGKSRRFWPLGDKLLVKFLGKEFITHQISSYLRWGEKIYIVANEKNIEAIRRSLFSFMSSGRVEIILQRKGWKGQGGAVLSSQGYIKGEVLILNADDVFNLSYLKAVLKLKKKNKCVLFAKKVESYFPGGYLVFDKKNRLIEIKEKPDSQNVPSQWVRLVADYFSDFSLLSSFLEEEKNKGGEEDWYERAINRVIKTQNSEFVRYNDYWYSLKYPWDVLKLNSFYLNSLADRVVIEKGVKIGKFVKMVPPVYIAKDVIVGDNVLIRGSSIGEGSLIGAFSEVARSFIADKVFLHRNYVGDSVLDSGILMGAGAVTANFRFDEKEVVKGSDLVKMGAVVGRLSKIGVNSTLLPGTIVGKKVWIGPGEVVGGKIEDKQFIFRKKVRDLR